MPVITMAYDEWMQRTRLGRLSRRSSSLQAVDRALNTYNRIPSEENHATLHGALLAFISEKGSAATMADPRNADGAIRQLLGQVLLGRRALPQALNNEIIQVAQNRLRDQMFGGAAQSTVYRRGQNVRTTVQRVGDVGVANILLRFVAERIADGLDCRISYGPIKTLASASRKVRDDYGGDWLQVKDAVRITVIATNGGLLTGVRKEQLVDIRQRIQSVCVASNGLSIMKNEMVTPESPNNACGYSGLNIVVRLGLLPAQRTGWNFAQVAMPDLPGEIQGNIPAMMYGKMSAQDLCLMFSREGYEGLSADLKIEGGLSHVFYEIWRVDREGIAGLAAAALSRRYHDYLRESGARQAERGQLAADIAAFKRDHPAAFAGQH